MENQQIRGIMVLMLLTVFILGSLSVFGATDAGEVSEAGEAAQVITGTGEGYNGPISVEVTVEDGTILGVEVVESSETEGISTPAFEEITEAVVNNQSTDGVDMVSGATGSSTGVLEAIEERSLSNLE